MIDFLLSPPFIIFYIMYSIIGWVFLSDYFVGCIHAKVPGFSGSLSISILMALLCGGITTGILIYTFFWALFVTIRDWKKIKKELDSDGDDDIL